MARQVRRISDLPEAGPLEGDELLEMVQGGINVRVRADELGSGGPIGDITIDDVQGLPEALDERVQSIVPGNGISVDDSDPANPVISATGSAGTEVNVQNGTAYTLALADAFKMVIMDSAGTNTLTVPPNSAVAFPANTRIDLGQDGAGQTTIVAGAGVTIRTPETLKLRKQWSKASLIRRAANVWDLVGDLEAAP